MTDAKQPTVLDGLRAAMRLGMSLGFVDARDGEVRVYLDGARVIDSWLPVEDAIGLLRSVLGDGWRGPCVSLSCEPTSAVARFTGRRGTIVVRKRVAVALVEHTNSGDP